MSSVWAVIRQARPRLRTSKLISRMPDALSCRDGNSGVARLRALLFNHSLISLEVIRVPYHEDKSRHKRGSENAYLEKVRRTFLKCYSTHGRVRPHFRSGSKRSK